MSTPRPTAPAKPAPPALLLGIDTEADVRASDYTLDPAAVEAAAEFERLIKAGLDGAGLDFTESQALRCRPGLAAKGEAWHLVFFGIVLVTPCLALENHADGGVGALVAGACQGSRRLDRRPVGIRCSSCRLAVLQFGFTLRCVKPLLQLGDTCLVVGPHLGQFRPQGVDFRFGPRLQGQGKAKNKCPQNAK